MVSPSIREGDLWDAETPRRSRCLLSARLFPVLHAREALGLEDVLWLLGLATVASEQLARWRTAWRMFWQELLPCLDTEAELGARQALFFLQGQRKVRRVLLGRQDSSLLPLARSAVHEGYHEAVLGTLDEGELASLAVSLGIRTVQCSPPPSVIPSIAGPHGGAPAGHPTSLGGCKPCKSRSPGDSLQQKWAGLGCSLQPGCGFAASFYFILFSSCLHGQ